MRKTVLDVRTAPSGHWVGDGFPEIGRAHV